MCIRDRKGCPFPFLTRYSCESRRTWSLRRLDTVSYTHLRAHETGRNLVCRLLLEKKKDAHLSGNIIAAVSQSPIINSSFFFNDTATTEIYTSLFVGSVRCV